MNFLIMKISLSLHSHYYLEFSDFLPKALTFCFHICAQSLSHVRLLTTPWTIAHQAPLSMEFSRQENWSGLPFPPLGDLAHSGIEPVSLVYPALASWFFTTSATWFSYLSISLAWDLILWMVCGSDIVNLFQSGQPVVLASLSKQSILSYISIHFCNIPLFHIWMRLFWFLCSNPLNILSILLPLAQCLHCYVFIMSSNLIREILSYCSPSKCVGYWHFYIWIRELTYQISHKHKNLWEFLLELYWIYRSIRENWSLYDIESSHYWTWYASLFSNVILSYCEYD